MTDKLSFTLPTPKSIGERFLVRTNNPYGEFDVKGDIVVGSPQYQTSNASGIEFVVVSVEVPAGKTRLMWSPILRRIGSG